MGAIRDAIFAGQLGPGDPLRELHLAKELQVSQPTVREALMELERYGLVVRKPNIDTTVTNMTARELRDRLELRVLMEKAAARKVSSTMTPADLMVLEQRLHALEQAAVAGNFFETSQADLEFHRFCWERSGNRALAQVLDCLTTPLFAFVSVMRGAWHSDLSQTVREHQAIFNAFRHGESTELEEALENHLSNAYRVFLDSGAEDFRAYVQRVGVERTSPPAAMSF